VPGEPLNLAAYRRQLEQDGSLVRCARCDRVIPATVTRCPECGVHFRGEAGDIAHAALRDRERQRKGRVAAVVAIVLVLVLLLTAIL
jgi:uncharacterized C2H2 Zn-finger protein